MALEAVRQRRKVSGGGIDCPACSSATHSPFQLGPGREAESAFLSDLALTLSRLSRAPLGLDPSEVYVDLKRGHLWTSSPSNSRCCCCGMLSRNDLDPVATLAEVSSSSSSLDFSAASQEASSSAEVSPARGNKGMMVVADSWRSRTAQWDSALEVASGLAAVGMVVHV